MENLDFGFEVDRLKYVQTTLWTGRLPPRCIWSSSNIRDTVWSFVTTPPTVELGKNWKWLFKKISIKRLLQEKYYGTEIELCL